MESKLCVAHDSDEFIFPSQNAGHCCIYLNNGRLRFFVCAFDELAVGVNKGVVAYYPSVTLVAHACAVL